MDGRRDLVLTHNRLMPTINIPNMEQSHLKNTETYQSHTDTHIHTHSNTHIHIHTLTVPSCSPEAQTGWFLLGMRRWQGGRPFLQGNLASVKPLFHTIIRCLLLSCDRLFEVFSTSEKWEHAGEKKEENTKLPLGGAHGLHHPDGQRWLQDGHAHISKTKTTCCQTARRKVRMWHLSWPMSPSCDSVSPALMRM